jgi:hypothetical protein
MRPLATTAPAAPVALAAVLKTPVKAPLAVRGVE